MQNSFIGGATVVFCLIFCVFSTKAQKQNENCNYWQSQVNPNIKMIERNGTKPLDVTKNLLKPDLNSSVLAKPFNDLDQKEIFFGIECLLKLQGNKHISNLSGATRPDVSQTFESNTIEVAALYYISYMFFQKWDHAQAPYLIDKDYKENSDEAVSQAYKAYNKWFEKIKKSGLEEARRQKLDPLVGSGVRWY